MDPLRLDEVARLVGGRVVGDPSVEIRGVAGLREAGPGEISFLARPDYAPLLRGTKAAAVLAPPGTQATVPLVIVEDPDAAFTRVIERFTPPARPPAPGVHPSASVHPGATVGEGASVGPGCVVEEGAVVGPRAVLRAGSSVGRDARIGADTCLHPGARVLDGCTVGDRCVLGPNCVVGADGFGFLPGGPGKPPRRVPQSGTVEIGDDCDLGACVTVARARFGRTILGRAVKVDCLVMIAHNVRIGDGAVLVAQSGVAGSTRVGRGVVLAAQAGIAGHLEIGDGAILGGRAGVIDDVPAGATMAGFPAVPVAEWRRREAGLRREARGARKKP